MRKQTENAAQCITLRKYYFYTYILYALGFFVGFTIFIAIVLSYLKRNATKNTWLESHVNWQIKTFWFTLIIIILGIVLLKIFNMVLLGFGILFLGVGYYFYHIEKGFEMFNRQQAIN